MDYSEINYVAIPVGTAFELQRRSSDLTSNFINVKATRIAEDGRTGFEITPEEGTNVASRKCFDDDEEHCLQGNRMYYRLREDIEYDFLGRVDNKVVYLPLGPTEPPPPLAPLYHCQYDFIYTSIN